MSDEYEREVLHPTLAKVYAGLWSELPSEQALEPLQQEWLDWFEGYDIAITDWNIDAAVCATGGLIKIIGEVASPKAFGMRTTLSAQLMSVAVIASLRPTRPEGWGDGS